MTKSKVQPVKAKDTEQVKVALIYVGHGGSTYCVGRDENVKIAKRAAKECKRVWKGQYKFPKDTVLTCHLYDITDVIDLWGYDLSGNVYDDETKKSCPYIEKIKVVV